MPAISRLDAWPILDSRGRWTLAVEVQLTDGARAQAQVPAGASTGTHEAHARPAADAVAHVRGEIAAAVQGRTAAGPEIDAALCALDGTAHKSRLGANAILGVSCAVARALSISRGEPLWRTLRAEYSPSAPAAIPLPMVNILSGGLHAGGQIELQDFLLLPLGAASFRAALDMTLAVHDAARREIKRRRYTLTGVADEGGWGPRLPSNEAALDLLTVAIRSAGFTPGREAAIALDVAATHFFVQGAYHLRRERRALSAAEFIDLLAMWRERYAILSIEDGLAEDDWEHWPGLTARLGSHTQLIGDDFFVTQEARLLRGVQQRCANSVLVKMNQIGSLAETFAVVEQARRAGYTAVISARSGETEDSFLADLAVAAGAGQIKIGSITRSERLAKYNRLLELEHAGGLPFAGATPYAAWLSSPPASGTS
jgi:enolase